MFDATMMALRVSDNAGNEAWLKANSPKDKFYRNQDGKLTKIPVLSFDIQPNPKSDVTPPVIQSLKLEKNVYSAGESLSLLLQATDDISGVAAISPQNGNGCCVAVTVSPDKNVLIWGNAVNGETTSLGGNNYRVTSFMINPYVSNYNGDYAIMSFSIYDNAENKVILSAHKETDPFYRDQSGKLTSIPVMKFHIQ